MLSERASRNAVAAVRASGTGAPAAQPTLSREWLYQVHESIRDVPLGTLSVPSNDTSPFENSGAAMSGAAFAGYSQTESPQNHGSVGMGFVRIQDINSVAASLADENGVVNAEAFFSAMRAEIPTLSSDPQAIAGAAFLSSRNGNDWATMFAESVVGYMNHSENGVDYLVYHARNYRDIVGDPLKDTSGPSLNILIKLSAILSLVFAPFFVTYGGILV